ncbi:hypothetical protein [Kibdelosporangium persicum]|uniref:hypothetical protein n=1 Tax=Kibdelosporangium persicum TaxID=2698649 RepID=UPI0015676FFB|nr:hypothetical protein [Kibdelosporangium persicum]
MSKLRTACVIQVWVGCGGVEDACLPAGVVDRGEDVLSRSGKGDGLDEVYRQDRFGLGAQDVSPRDGRPVWGWGNTLGLEDFHTVEGTGTVVMP